MQTDTGTDPYESGSSISINKFWTGSGNFDIKIKNLKIFFANQYFEVLQFVG